MRNIYIYKFNLLKALVKGIDSIKDKIVLDKGLYSLDGFCLLDDSNSLVLDDNDMFIERPSGIKDLYLFMYNKDFDGCLNDYFTLTGYPSLIPRNALGAWWYKNDNYKLEDIGNLVNRKEHSQSGAVMAWSILNDMGCDPGEIATIVTAIGNHDEGTGVPVNAVAAALIIADKSDVRRSRVRRQADIKDDIHDRVNYSVTKADLDIDTEAITLRITIETELCNVLEYFEIFLDRMLLCRKAAVQLGVEFHLVVNGQQMM